MKTYLIICFLIIGSQVYGRLELKAEQIEGDRMIQISIVNDGEEPESLYYPDGSRYPGYVIDSPFYVRLEGFEGEYTKGANLWWNNGILSSQVYTKEEWKSFFLAVTLQPHEELVWKGSLKEMIRILFPGESLQGRILRFRYDNLIEERVLLSDYVLIE